MIESKERKSQIIGLYNYSMNGIIGVKVIRSISISPVLHDMKTERLPYALKRSKINFHRHQSLITLILLITHEKTL